MKKKFMADMIPVRQARGISFEIQSKESKWCTAPKTAEGCVSRHFEVGASTPRGALLICFVLVFSVTLW